MPLLLWGCSDDSATQTGGPDGSPDATGTGVAGAGGLNGNGGAAGASAGGRVTSATGGQSSGSGGTGPGGGGSGGQTSENGGSNSGGAGTGGTAPAVVRVVGRTDGNAAAPRFEWSGVSIQARFRGTSVAADIDGGDNNYFEIVVDGQVEPKVATTSGRQKVDLVTGLPDSVHDLVMWRRTEADDFAPTQFFGLDFGGGTLLAMPEPSHKIEVIGDSITCGYGDEGAGPNCPFSFDQENNYLAYGSVAARELEADVYTECWSGKGMYRDRDGNTSEQLPTLFDRAIPTESGSQWDFSWIPDAVVIDLGTNDFAQGDPGQAYVTAYESFVDELRTHYPNAYIFVIIGPMTGGSDLTTTRGYLDQVVQARKAVGDNRITQVNIDPQDGNANGLGCDYHPSIKTHDAMGKALAAAMKIALGW